jgi:hypothetical protein
VTLIVPILYNVAFPLSEKEFYQKSLDLITEHNSIGVPICADTVVTQGKIFILFTDNTQDNWMVAMGIKAPFFRKFKDYVYLTESNPTIAGEQYDSVQISGAPPKMELIRHQIITNYMLAFLAICVVWIAALLQVIALFAKRPS